VETAKYVTALKNVEIKCNNKLIARSEYSNSLKNYQPQVFTYGTTQTTERKYYYINSAEYSTIITRNVFDNYGNVLRNVTKYNGTDSVVNVNTFDNQEDKWFLGRLKTAQVTIQKNGGSVTKSSEFTYDPNNGLLTKETIEPNDPTLGFSKIYEHDAYGNISKSTQQNITGTIKRTQRSLYDEKGRTEKEGITEYIYDTRWKGALSTVKFKAVEEQEFYYDAYGRVSSVTQKIDGRSFVTSTHNPPNLTGKQQKPTLEANWKPLCWATG